MRARPRVSQVWALSFFTICYICLCEAQAGSSNVSISNTSPEIRYTPFLCPTTAETCDGAWRVMDIDGASVVSTNGPSDAENDILPQMFFSFRASTIFVQTSSLSNATVNLTIFAGNVAITAIINSSLRNFTVVQLPEDEVTTLSLTFIAGAPSRLDIGNIIITVSDPTGNSATSSFLPTQTLPPPIILPSFVPPSRALPSTTASSLPISTTIASPSLKRLVGLAVGLVVGLGLGLTVLAAALWWLWRRRRIKAASQFTLSSGYYSRKDREQLWFRGIYG
ncbi:hypothetical protein C8J56DRAFT_800380 [Mycena floridula]|nr:hypothetical protein C8J56DRAFT_800380 [Mycena floridula]